MAKLAECRHAHGMTQEQLSTASGVARVTIARLERGRTNPTLDTLTRLACALGVNVGELIETEVG